MRSSSWISRRRASGATSCAWLSSKRGSGPRRGQRAETASFKLTYRLRNHRDDSVEVHEAVYEGQDGEPGAIQGADDLAEAFVGLGYGPTVHKLLLQTTDVFLILDRLSKAPWAEVRHVGPPIGIA